MGELACAFGERAVCPVSNTPTAVRLSGAAESHRRALLEPDVNLSVHPAPSIQPLAIEKRPVGEEPWRGPDDSSEPFARSLRRLPETLEFATHPSPQMEVKTSRSDA